MEELLRQLEELRNENSKLKERISIIDKGRAPLGPLTIPSKANTENVYNNSATSHVICNNSQSPGLLDNDVNLLFYLKSILGYSIKYEEGTVILKSVYSFCNEDRFEVEIRGNKLILKNTDYLSEWTEEFNTYVAKGKSYCAFFAAITLNLFNRNTFG